MVDWDEDGRKDLLVGTTDGLVMIYLNVGTDADPVFDGGSRVQVGPPGSKVDIDVGARATPIAIDWESDGRRDLVVGALDGRLRLFRNQGTVGAPDFRAQEIVQVGDADLVVPTGRSSPAILDVTHDGKKDILSGNTEGQLVLYENTGCDVLPIFSGFVLVESLGVPVDLPSFARSRPSVCRWTEDGVPDVLIGGADGLVHLYPGVDVLTGASPEDPEWIVRGTRLLPPHPNPFRPRAAVPFVLARGGAVRVSVYDPAGRRVATLTDRTLGPGAHQTVWNGRTDGGRPVPAGTYFVRLEAGDARATAKIVRLR